MKFSIIVPVYQVEKYIDRCLDSILKQSYLDFEVIIVNDGSMDASGDIADHYCKKDKRFIQYHKKNGGLSDARNFGVKKAKGDYLLFVDSDDYIADTLLEKLAGVIEQEKMPDVVRFQIVQVTEKQKAESKLLPGRSFCAQSGFTAFQMLIKEDLFEPACCYAYRKSFWNKHHFAYEKGCYHEDFGLTPLVILKARRVCATSFYGYYYLKRDNSITMSQDRQKQKKRCYDVLKLYDYLVGEVEKEKMLSEAEKRYVKSYLVNALLGKGKLLRAHDLKEYQVELKKRKVDQWLQDDTFLHRVKRYLVRYHLNFYMKFLAK